MPDQAIVDCPYYLLTRASLATTAVMRRELAAAGYERIRPAYLGALMCLWSGDGRKVGELGRCAGLEPSTMTGLVDRMERDGLLERRPDPHDRRAWRVFLTDAGQRAEATVTEVVDTTLDRMTDGLDEADTDTFKRILGQVLANATR
jgi:MarR family transcriptional regulator, organic hydroperoxide resistance regulator